MEEEYPEAEYEEAITPPDAGEEEDEDEGEGEEEGEEGEEDEGEEEQPQRPKSKKPQKKKPTPIMRPQPQTGASQAPAGGTRPQETRPTTANKAPRGQTQQPAPTGRSNTGAKAPRDTGRPDTGAKAPRQAQSQHAAAGTRGGKGASRGGKGVVRGKGAYGGKGGNKVGAKRRAGRSQKAAIEGISKPDIRRMARRGGVKRISTFIYDDTRAVLKQFLENNLRKSIYYTEHAKRKTVSALDVVYGLKRGGVRLYGFGA
jgi:histone H4